MNIDLKPMEELKVDGKVFVVQPDPDPDMTHRPYIELGGSGLVVQLLLAKTNNYYALKVFNNPEKSLIKNTKNLEKNKIPQLPGLIAAQRAVINPKESLYSDLINKHPSLEYSVLMPWIGGYTWFEILGDNKLESKIPIFSKEVSLYYASQLSRVLASLEAKGYAHCDICSNNIILDFKNSSVQLIDIEDMYLPGALRSDDFIGGQNGYAHPNRSLGHQWVKESDRFGGGLLISEILTWCDPKIREASDSESYATPLELCKDSKKYSLMRNAISQQGSSELANLFDKLWNSNSLKDCPTLNEWEQQINIATEAGSVPKPALDGLSQLGADGRIRIQRKRVSVDGKLGEPTSNISATRKKVDVGVPLKASSKMPVPSSAPLPNFQPDTDWGKVVGWILLIVLIAVVFIVISTAIGGYLIINNTPVPSATLLQEDVAPLAIIPSFTPRPIPTAALIPTKKPTQRPTQKPELSCSGVVINLVDTDQGDIVHIKPCSGREYDMPPMVKGAYALGPNKGFIVYAGNDGMLYAAKISVDSWYVVENLRKTGEFSAFYKNETPRFSISFSGDGVPYWVTIYEAMFSQSATIQIPLKISQ